MNAPGSGLDTVSFRSIPSSLKARLAAAFRLKVKRCCACFPHTVLLDAFNQYDTVNAAFQHDQLEPFYSTLTITPLVVIYGTAEPCEDNPLRIYTDVAAIARNQRRLPCSAASSKEVQTMPSPAD